MFRRRSGLVILLCLIVISFFGVLTVSASMFPKGYDWRYRVISSLISPRDNPQHYRIAAGGLILTGLFMLPFAQHLIRGLGPVARIGARIAGGAFLLGIVALIADCFVVPQHVHATLGIRRLHEFLARSSAGFLAIGMLSGCWCAWKGAGRSLPRSLFWIWVAVTVLPLTGVICSEALLLVSASAPKLSQPIKHALRHSVFWHLGFWEWIGAVAVFVFLCAATFLIPGAEGLPTSDVT